MGTEIGIKCAPMTGERGKVSNKQKRCTQTGQSVPVLVPFGGHNGMCATAENSRTLTECGADFALTSRRPVLCSSGEAAGRNCLGLNTQKALKFNLPGSSVSTQVRTYMHCCKTGFPAVVGRCETRSL